jgi:hypothetical protein
VLGVLSGIGFWFDSPFIPENAMNCLENKNITIFG